MTGKHRSHCCSSLHKLLVPLIFLCGSPFIHAEAGPDLSAEQLDAGAVRTDPQTLLLSGTLAVTVKNGGGAPAPANISVTVFSDTNLNGAYDAGIDASLGEAFIENPLAAAESITLDIAVNGQMPFRDAP
ncbi:MAG: hypothetical protein GY862_18565, partial [Gammaproteobacteria bacterium]|nr:hypothetical protein [Gammaproteobacteria bacterium]